MHRLTTPLGTLRTPPEQCHFKRLPTELVIRVAAHIAIDDNILLSDFYDPTAWAAIRSAAKDLKALALTSKDCQNVAQEALVHRVAFTIPRALGERGHFPDWPMPSRAGIMFATQILRLVRTLIGREDLRKRIRGLSTIIFHSDASDRRRIVYLPSAAGDLQLRDIPAKTIQYLSGIGIHKDHSAQWFWELRQFGVNAFVSVLFAMAPNLRVVHIQPPYGQNAGPIRPPYYRGAIPITINPSAGHGLMLPAVQISNSTPFSSILWNPAEAPGPSLFGGSLDYPSHSRTRQSLVNTIHSLQRIQYLKLSMIPSSLPLLHLPSLKTLDLSGKGISVLGSFSNYLGKIRTLRINVAQPLWMRISLSSLLQPRWKLESLQFYCTGFREHIDVYDLVKGLPRSLKHLDMTAFDRSDITETIGKDPFSLSFAHLQSLCHLQIPAHLVRHLNHYVASYESSDVLPSSLRILQIVIPSQNINEITCYAFLRLCTLLRSLRHDGNASHLRQVGVLVAVSSLDAWRERNAEAIEQLVSRAEKWELDLQFELHHEKAPYEVATSGFF